MSKQKYYIGQGPWHLIKQYLGLKPEYCYKEFMNLELEVIQNIWYKKAGRIIGLDGPSCYDQPTPYQFQMYKWNKDVKTSVMEVCKMTVTSTDDFNAVVAAVMKSCLGYELRHYNKEVSEQYYKKHYPEFLATLRAMDSILSKDKNLRSKPFDAIKPIDTNRLLNIELEELTLKATLEAAQAGAAAHSQFCVLKKTILAQCTTSPHRLEVYKALNQAVHQRYRLCACGCTVPTTGRAFQKHLKSNKHCKKVLQNCTGPSLEAWYQSTGTVPPGFTRNARSDFSHIIPEDSKRPVLHTVRHKNSVDLGKFLYNSPWGRGCDRIIV